MQLIRKNYPVVIAWLAYVVSAWLLKVLLVGGTFWLQKWFAFELSSSSYALILIVIRIAGEYMGYASSVRWVAVPLSLLAKNLSTKPKAGFLIFDWLSFWYYFILFCLPLFVINAFPLFTFDVRGLPISKELAGFIGIAWISVASLVAYRGIFLSYLKDAAKEHSNVIEYQASVR